MPESIFSKVADLRSATLLKRDWHRCFPVNFAKKFTNIFFYRTPPVAASEGTFLDYSNTFWRGYPQILSNISVSCNSVYVACIL